MQFGGSGWLGSSAQWRASLSSHGLLERPIHLGEGIPVCDLWSYVIKVTSVELLALVVGRQKAYL